MQSGRVRPDSCLACRRRCSHPGFSASFSSCFPELKRAVPTRGKQGCLSASSVKVGKLRSKKTQDPGTAGAQNLALNFQKRGR